MLIQKKVSRGRGHARRSDTRLEPPCPPGAGVERAALAHGWSPPPHRGLGMHAPLWPTAGAPLLKKQFSSNINQNCIWLMFDIKMSTKTLPGCFLISNVNRNCIWLMFDIKRQPELYLVDV